MDDIDENQRLPHHHEPKEFVSLDKLAGKDQAKNYISSRLIHIALKKLDPRRRIHQIWLIVVFVYTLMFDTFTVLRKAGEA
ncbi:hypothetical protein H5410_006091 [Solanum commersonii]|uniref:Uncharacterized protein n=1 Tax=Solanum commersonii TaxID=4109 RepID=A0A9J6A8Q0_SOLCO|nr:hypothetical protein H5410_006091 [Solanum commersonii]